MRDIYEIMLRRLQILTAEKFLKRHYLWRTYKNIWRRIKDIATF
jgi:hypothetical protein